MNGGKRSLVRQVTLITLVLMRASAVDLRAADLNTVLPPLIESHAGDVSVAVRHLETGEQFLWRADAVQPTASLIKLAIMVSAYRMADAGSLDLQKHVILQDSDRVPGSGILTDHFTAGAQFSVRDAIRLMIRYSDNTATNLVVDQTGLPATAQTMELLGYPQTRLNSKVYRRDTSISPERSQLFGLGSTTARETVSLLESLERRTAATEESCDAMLQHLLSCDDKTMLVRNLPSGVKVAHKSGAVNESRCDAGIIYGSSGPIAVCVLTTRNTDTSWGSGNAAQVLIGEIGSRVYSHFNPVHRQSENDDDTLLRTGAFGIRVEMLQRTLNQRLTPSPQLGVDGDFGPMTESAVRQFQESTGLPVTGVVDSAFWESLGPVIEEPDVPSPETVNGQPLPQESADPPEGRPFVTCDDWIIVDGDSGQTLDSEGGIIPRDFASTTKIMTAWLVVRLAESDPEILSEELTMSKRADETRGSTSGVREGETLSVREALYGLMLPSGNDMSVALAEHFGVRLSNHAKSSDDAEQTDPEAVDPLSLFVEAMNREAVRLEMGQTGYRNPHGLTAPGHLSTPADLALLSRYAFRNDLFREIVSTRRRGASVTGRGGYTRNLLWTNTNDLLKTEGYDGVKTGTTDRAGACLVSTAERDGRRLIVVVLGSAASRARYTDTRNLFRWGWRLVAEERPSLPSSD